MGPRFNEMPKDWGNWFVTRGFVISRFVFFYLEYRSLYRSIYRGSLNRGSAVISFLFGVMLTLVLVTPVKTRPKQKAKAGKFLFDMLIWPCFDQKNI